MLYDHGVYIQEMGQGRRAERSPFASRCTRRSVVDMDEYCTMHSHTGPFLQEEFGPDLCRDRQSFPCSLNNRAKSAAHARPRLPAHPSRRGQGTILILIMLGLYDNDSRSWPLRRVAIRLESRKRLCGTARELTKPAGYLRLLPRQHLLSC